ncbi:MAG TPA: carboxypeptidase-like regulatory domain-containing protein, partial [Fodinibius sp.]|nr:carboxypeptidase-like regulatory domain-containing protein [Fodinibius sp.]
MGKKCHNMIKLVVWVAGMLSIQSLLLCPVALSQNVSGTVTDAQSGETLPGVNVMVKGTTTGTSTGSDGNYEFNVSSLQDTLVFSFIGYQTQEAAINERTEINVNLTPQAISGEEMVVVGYGTQSTRQLSSSVSNIGAEELADQPVGQLSQKLQGKIAGA